jgi:alkanesulfonate monooxygenase SsuD/methylene tetrahydromethanopterin reductase-like flavin-dependent oxidoreductase (luciferase family)
MPRSEKNVSDLQFGVFDHLDRLQQPLPVFYEERLRIVQLYDELGFHRYHVAEHHATPLGMAPSPSVFLSAVAQRTKRLRFGPLVYLLPLYNPLRLVEEIAMLDALSNGRLDVGVGRGQTPKEMELYGSDPAEGQALFDEALEVIQQAFVEGRVHHEGPNFHFPDVPLTLNYVQKPHPPLWYGVGSPDSASKLAARGLNAVTLMKPAAAEVIVERYLESARTSGHPDLRIGLARFIVVGDTDEAALALAQRAYAKWHEAFHTIYTRYGTTPVQGFRPLEYQQMVREGLAIAGSPETVTAALQREIHSSRANYIVGQFVFGDMTETEAEHSIRLFAAGVMPTLAALSGPAAVPLR